MFHNWHRAQAPSHHFIDLEVCLAKEAERLQKKIERPRQTAGVLRAPAVDKGCYI